MSSTRAAGISVKMRLAAALALVGSVEGQGDETLLGEFFGVEGRDLLLDRAERVRYDDRGKLRASAEAGRLEQIAHHCMAVVRKGDSFHIHIKSVPRRDPLVVDWAAH